MKRNTKVAQKTKRPAVCWECGNPSMYHYTVDNNTPFFCSPACEANYDPEDQYDGMYVNKQKALGNVTVGNEETGKVSKLILADADCCPCIGCGARLPKDGEFEICGDECNQQYADMEALHFRRVAEADGGFVK